MFRDPFKNEAFLICLQAGVRPHAIGIPGCAKSATARSLAEATGRVLFLFTGSTREPCDVGGIPFPGEIDGKGCFTLKPPEWAVRTHNKKKHIVIFDECNDHPAMQKAVMKVLSDGMAGDFPLADDTWLGAISNPTEISCDGHAIAPPVANRLIHLQWETDTAAWLEGMRNACKFPAPRMPILPDDWEEDFLGEEAFMVSQFIERDPSNLELPKDGDGNVDMTKVQQAQLEAGYPSQRSWHNLTLALAAARSVNSPGKVRRDLAMGAVGAVGLEYLDWVDALDLPDPREAVEAAVAALRSNKPVTYNKLPRPDQNISHMGAVVQWVVGDKNDSSRYNPENFQAVSAYLSSAIDKQKDLVVLCLPRLLKNIPKGASLDANLMGAISGLYELGVFN